MPRYLHAPQADRPAARPPARRSDLHVVILGLVWLTVASGAIVFSEPAPFDVAMMGLIVLLPIAGLATFTPGMLVMLAGWLVIAATGIGAAAISADLAKSTIHTIVTLYLSLAAFVLAGFINRRPEKHFHLIMNAYMWSAAISSLLGIVGYFSLVPGAFDLFTEYGRARGAFKDPNVFGPYLVPPLVYAVYLWLSRPVARAFVPLVLVMLMAFALFLSFSRGAWVNLAVALGAFGYLSFLLARSNWARLKLALVALAGVVMLGGVALVALQLESVSNLAEQRVSLDQGYDQGPEGRFGGQLKALRLMLENPLGLGAGEFTVHHHHEEVHNVYLSMMLNNGWTGGILWAMMMVISLLFGLRQLLRRTDLQPILIVAWSCLLGVVLEGAIVDTDHWRHLFVLIGLVWGLGEAARVPQVVSRGRLPQRLRQIGGSRPVFAAFDRVPYRHIRMAAHARPMGKVAMRARRAGRSPTVLRGSLRLN